MLSVTFQGPAVEVLTEMRQFLAGTAAPKMVEITREEVIAQGASGSVSAEPTTAAAAQQTEKPTYVVRALDGTEKSFAQESRAVNLLASLAEAVKTGDELTSLGEANEGLREMLSEKGLEKVKTVFGAKRASLPASQPVAEEPVAEIAPETVVEPAATEPAPAAEADKPLTLDDIRLKLKDVYAINVLVAQELLTKFGVQKVSEIPADKYPDFIAQADAAIAVNS